MKQLANLPRRARWAVPAGIVAMAGGVLAGSHGLRGRGRAAAAAAHGGPAARRAGRDDTAPPLTGTVVETASLGLPALPSVGDTISLPSLLAGSHTINVWYADPSHLPARRTAEHERERCDPQRRQPWLWGSSANR